MARVAVIRVVWNRPSAVEDFSAAVDFLTNHPAVYADKIGVIGICGGGCYSVSATQIDHRIKALATISMYDMGRARRQGVATRRLTNSVWLSLMKSAASVRWNMVGLYARISVPCPKKWMRTHRSLPSTSSIITTIHNAVSIPTLRLLLLHEPRTDDELLPLCAIETISPRPMLFIVGENAVSKYFSEDAYAKAAEPKELFVVPGATHVDLYDQPKYLKITLPKLDSFLLNNI